MKIGIVGSENSHTIHIAKTLNADKAVPGFEVTHVWGETDEFAQNAAREGQIPNIVKEPEEMIGQIEGFVVDHRHAKYHLPAVRPLVEAGLPGFIDKPFCIDLEEGIEFVRFARAKGVPITSFSTVPLSKSARDFQAQLKKLGKLRAMATAGPLDIESEYGGVYFYGIHQVDLMLQSVEAVPTSVSAVRNGEDGVAVISFDSGLVGVVNCLREWYGGGFIATAYGDEGVHHTPIKSDEKPYLTGVEMFCRMFHTGEEPLPPASYLRPVAVLQAMQKSFDTGQPVEVAGVPDF